jgi:hypothetical protein
MMANIAVTSSLADQLRDFGGIAADRVRLTPAPGSATVDDLVAANLHGKPLCELIDQTLVEKSMGYEASVVAAAIARIVGNFIIARRLGLVSGPDGMFQLLSSSVRGPDVAFVSRERLPAGKFPAEAYPAIAPDLMVGTVAAASIKEYEVLVSQQCIHLAKADAAGRVSHFLNKLFSPSHLELSYKCFIYSSTGASTAC